MKKLTKAEEKLMFRIAKSNDPILMMKHLDFVLTGKV